MYLITSNENSKVSISNLITSNSKKKEVKLYKFKCNVLLNVLCC